jgi:hypothetical protein
LCLLRAPVGGKIMNLGGLAALLGVAVGFDSYGRPPFDATHYWPPMNTDEHR